MEKTEFFLEICTFELNEYDLSFWVEIAIIL